jgi:hypothetical protein
MVGGYLFEIVNGILLLGVVFGVFCFTLMIMRGPKPPRD